MIVIMPVTGVGMGYYSGWGVPFFKWQMPGIAKAKADTEKMKNRTGFFYKTHKFFAQILEFLIPIHVGGAAFQYFARGQNSFRRMNPFRKGA